MRTMILFNDNSPEAVNARKFALRIAKKMAADILVLNLCKMQETMVLATAAAGSGNHTVNEADARHPKTLLVGGSSNDDFRPSIIELDATGYTEKDICELVIRKNVWMMVKGIETHVTHDILSQVDIQSILNHVACPLLLIPDNYTGRGFQNITYAVDMRYCRSTILKFLSELAHNYRANLVIEHFSAKGLPHLGDDYAGELFNNEIANKIKYDRVYFNNIKERNLGTAVEVMVNNLHADLLALVNHRFHFEELFGRSIKKVLPEHVPIPVIIFPL